MKRIDNIYNQIYDMDNLLHTERIAKALPVIAGGQNIAILKIS
jgi:hypothetical protein